MRRAVLALAVAALLAAPASASAVSITVNTNADGAPADDGLCTLREAIDSANTNTASGAMPGECAAGGASDVIGFSAIFNGELADTIAPGSALPSITTDTDIAGGQCMTAAGVNGPCVGVNGPTGVPGLTVDNIDNTSISGVAATGAQVGIRLINSVAGFSATNNWLGVKLDGTAGANNTGVFIDPDSSGATIGGTTPAVRNVFANNSEAGLDILGADDNTIQGNYFGVAPDGTTPASPTVKPIEISGSTAPAAATGNLIGGTPSAGEAASQACDGPCNVIGEGSSNNSGGIDLQGNGGAESEMPAGQTAVRGNYVGLDAAGAGLVGNLNSGVHVGSAANVTVGGPAGGDGNRINDSVSAGIIATGASAVIQNNIIGLNFDQTAMFGPTSTFGILAGSSMANPTTVTGNRIAKTGGLGSIDLQGAGAAVTGNEIGRGIGGQSLPGGAVGITAGSGTGNHIINDNLIQNASSNGIRISGPDNNTMIANHILGSGAAAIRIQQGSSMNASTGNTIGGDLTADENVISNSGGDAVEIVEDGNDNNHVVRNTGSGNAGLFIDLGADGPGNNASTGPNAGIQAPAIGSAQTDTVSGTAQPLATVRVFSKATAANGEIAGFLGSASADGSGNWSVTYSAPVAPAVPIGVTQSLGAAGTSEMAVVTTTGRTLTVNKAGSGTGTLTSIPSGISCGADCSEVYANGTSVTLTAAPNSGSVLGGFSGCDSTAGNQCTVNMTADKTVTATFNLKPSNEFTLGKLAKNKNNGTAMLAATFPGPGVVTLTGNGLKATASKVIGGAGTVQLKVRAKGAKRAKLEKDGFVTVKPKVTYAPTGGDPATKSTKIKLIDRT